MILDAGISISWAMNPDGSYPGTEYHAQEEDAFRQLIDAQTPAIEALFDEMEATGRKITSPNDPKFNSQQQTAYFANLTQVNVLAACAPQLTQDELHALAARIAALLIPSPTEVPDLW